MAAESIWKVRPAARKFETDPDLVIPAVQHPLEDAETKNKIAAFWTKWESKKLESKKSEEKGKETYDFEDPLGRLDEFEEKQIDLNFRRYIWSCRRRGNC